MMLFMIQKYYEGTAAAAERRAGRKKQFYTPFLL